MKQLTVGGIYSAAGSGLLGARSAGCEVVYSYEPRGFVHEDTIFNNFSDIVFSRDLNAFRSDKGLEADIIIGQPPCKRFSSLAVRRKDRGDFDLSVFEVFKFFQEIWVRYPHYFILENLKGILKHVKVYDGGLIITDGYGEETKCDMPHYTFQIIELNSKDFNCPQSRKRTFIIGSTRDFNYVPYQVKFEEQKNLWQTIEKYNNTNSLVYNNNVAADHSIKRINGFARLEHGESYYGTQNNRRLYPNKISPTLTSHRTQYVHPFLSRTLTTREVAALMGYPDDFIFYGSKTAQLDQAGCSVVPIIIQDICTQIIQHESNI